MFNRGAVVPRRVLLASDNHGVDAVDAERFSLGDVNFLYSDVNSVAAYSRGRALDGSSLAVQARTHT